MVKHQPIDLLFGGSFFGTHFHPTISVLQALFVPNASNMRRSAPAGVYTTYKNGADWGMVYGIVLPTLVCYCKSQTTRFLS